MKTLKTSAKPRVREVISTQTIPLNRPQQGASQATAPQVPPGHPGYAAHHQARQQPSSSPPPNFTTPKTTAELDPAFVSVGVPSQFQFYDFKTLSLRPLLGIHISKFSRAQKESSLRWMVEGIGSTLEPGISGFDLTPGDFYFLMYWQRVNSFAKHPMMIEAWCEDKKHQLEVIEGVEQPDGTFVKKDKETLHLQEILNKTTLDTKNLAPVPWDRFADLHEKYILDVERMRDVVEVTERVLELEIGLPEFEYLASKAAFLRSLPGRESLDERCKIVESMTADELQELDQYIEVATDYGVSESTNIKCKDCGASTRVNISFDALTFLPGGR